MAVICWLLVRFESFGVSRSRDEAGQSTAEYALVIVAAVAIGGLLISFLGKSDIVSGIFGKIVDLVMSHI
jgi:Flp pilus assembly pilin Flp